MKELISRFKKFLNEGGNELMEMSDPMAKIMKEPLGAPSGNPYAEEPTMSDEEFEAIFGKGPQENSREVKVTDEQKAEMLRVAQDLYNIVKTHDAVEGTRLLGSMYDRDKLTSAAYTLESLVAQLNRNEIK